MENNNVMNSNNIPETPETDTVSKRFRVTITHVAGRELTARERIKAKDVSNGAIGLNDCVPKADEGALDLTVAYYMTTHTENPNAKEGNDREYETLIIVAVNKADPEAGEQRYYTGSGSLVSSFLGFMEELEEAGEEIPGTEIRVYRKPSTGRRGKEFLTCELL